jgi:hypothetical protein
MCTCPICLWMGLAASCAFWWCIYPSTRVIVIHRVLISWENTTRAPAFSIPAPFRSSTFAFSPHGSWGHAHHALCRCRRPFFSDPAKSNKGCRPAGPFPPSCIIRFAGGPTPSDDLHACVSKKPLHACGLAVEPPVSNASCTGVPGINKNAPKAGAKQI